MDPKPNYVILPCLHHRLAPPPPPADLPFLGPSTDYRTKLLLGAAGISSFHLLHLLLSGIKKMPVLQGPTINLKTTLLPPIIPAARATTLHVNTRQEEQIKNPGGRSMSICSSKSRPTLTSYLFGRCGNSNSSLKPAMFTGDVEFHTNLSKREGPGRVGFVKLQRGRYRCPRAYLDFPYRIPYPEVVQKPVWWWRTLACIPYLMALQLSDVAFYFQPLMERWEQFEFLSYYVPGAIRRLPTWFLMVYCFLVYMGVVRNKQWPHFFRYHVMMGLLLENALQIVWHASNFMPLINYWGKFGMLYWAMVGLAFITLLLECIRCALAGMYVTIPFISNAAYIHTPYAKGDS